ncbi:hypothetical protein [Paractinoplanes atraurantiacus]|nr:hypothetical protein [Actinoplanes atraurantiacus]
MGRGWALWWVLAGVAFAGAVALFAAIFLFDMAPHPLFYAALPVYGIMLGRMRNRLKTRSDQGLRATPP